MWFEDFETDKSCSNCKYGNKDISCKQCSNCMEQFQFYGKRYNNWTSEKGSVER